MHDLSDGFVLPGVKSQVKKFTVNTSAVELRTNDGSAKISLETGSHNVNVITTGHAIVDAPNIDLIGRVSITGFLTVNGLDMSTHHHGGVTTGSGTTGTPV